MRWPAKGFTLIELLVSIAIGMGLLALGASALLHIGRVFNRNTAQLQAGDDANAIHQRLEAAFSAMHHTAQLRVRVDPGETLPATPVWADGNEVLELTWMSTLSDIDELAMDTLPGHLSDVVWNRLRWSGRGVGRPGGLIEYAVSSPFRLSNAITSPAASTTSGRVRTGPQHRRDRRRDMEDNDLRHLPGMTAARHAALQAFSDETDLVQNLRRMHPAYTQVREMSIEWVDQDGYTVRADAVSGITVRDPGGTLLPALGQPYANDRLLVLDGAWLDGRPAASAGTTRHASAQRPLHVRVSFVLVPTSHEDPEDLSREPHLPFSFTFRTAPLLPRL